MLAFLNRAWTNTPLLVHIAVIVLAVLIVLAAFGIAWAPLIYVAVACAAILAWQVYRVSGMAHDGASQ